MRTVKQIATEIQKLTEELQAIAWSNMQNGKTTKEKKKAAADWNRSISINAQISEIIKREGAAENENENPTTDNVRGGRDGGDTNKK